MYATPTKADLDRNLSTILRDAHQKARTGKLCLTSEFVARGMGRSTSLIGAVAGLLDGLHREALERASPMLRDFAERMQIAPPGISAIARSHLKNMGNAVLGELPPAGFPTVHQQFRRQYQAIFDQRLEGALRDFEIGFAGGRNQLPKAPEDQIPSVAPKDKAEELFNLKPGLWGMSINLKEALRRVRNRWARGQ